MERIYIKNDMSRTARKSAIDCACLLGFQTEKAKFPVITPGSEVITEGLWHTCLDKAPKDYKPANKAGPLFKLDFRRKKGLENLFSDGLFLFDTDGDFLPDKLELRLVLPEDADAYMVSAACNLAFRFGMETTRINGSIAEGKSGKTVRFTGQGVPKVRLADEKTVEIGGSGQALMEFIALLCNRFPKNGVMSWRDLLLTVTDDLTFRTKSGQLAYLSGKSKGKATLFHSPGLEEKIKARFPDADFINHRGGKAVYSRTYDFTWEVDDFTELFEKYVLPRLETGDVLTLDGAVSEDRSIREELLGRIISMAESKGAAVKDSRILCAYKQGFSWLEEYVIPKLEGKKITEIDIGFKPFLPEGETEWHDENGATPSYHNTGTGGESRWYDLPIRYLQELYPIEDILVKRLNIPPESVKFTIHSGDETYSVTAAFENGKSENYRYTARVSRRQYIDDYPKLGRVHPSTGYIKADINGKKTLDMGLKTDLEKVWDVYQSEVLPQCRRYIEGKYADISDKDQPFFQRLNIDVTLSEPDYCTGSREDMISSLDALHEDMYFVGGDYFKNYGLEKCGVIFDAPGLILPVIHNKKGAPILKVTLYEQLAEQPMLVENGEKKAEIRPRDAVNAWISGISRENDRIAVEITVTGADSSVLCAYAELITEGVAELSHLTDSLYLIRFIGENGEVFTARPVGFSKNKGKKITDIDLCENRLISYEMYLGIMEQLREVEGVEVFKTAESYMGRSLFAVYLSDSFDGYVSMTKKLTRCPSLLINARHHANEVSSTNASFILLKKLLTEKKYENLADKLTLVLVPLENTDGAAIHYELQKEHPTWKLHVARFNAVGKEFYHEHFKDDTVYSEAMGLTRLYEKFIPDILVDNHGVPSHEWEQQFSGYTSPSYKGFWLPRSLLYGYFWYVTDDEYCENYPLNRKMEEVIADRIAQDGEMAALNREWSRQFEKYAHSWMPKLFPADYYKGMINYWIPFTHDPAHRYPSIRFPWLTSVAYTSEAADETAQGEYLNLCARAHAAHDEATIDMILGAKIYYDCGFDEESFTAGCVRLRPITAK